MAARGLARTATWLIRLLQLFFSIILMGIVSYMIHQFRKYGGGDDSVPDELIVPEVASVLGIVVSIFSILAIFFLGYTLQLVAAFLDFVIFVLYLASAGLLRHNFHGNSNRNPLRNALIDMRVRNGESARVNRNSGLVKMLVAGVVIQIILFFITTLLGFFVASRTADRRESRRSRRAMV